MAGLGLGLVGASIRRAAAARGAPRRLMGTLPSPMSDSEMRLYNSISEVEAATVRKVHLISVEKSKLKVALKDALALFNQSTSKAAEAVRETANVSVTFLSGTVLVALGVVYSARPQKTGSLTAVESAKAAAASAAAAAESAAASAAAAHASVKSLEERFSILEKKP